MGDIIKHETVGGAGIILETSDDCKESYNCKESYDELVSLCKEMNIKECISSVSTTIDKKTIVNIIPEMDKPERVKRLMDHLTFTNVKHEIHIMKLNTLKDAHVYCVIHNVSAQQYGPLLEKFIQIKFNYTKNKAESCIGDCFKDGKNSEIKVSLGGTTHTKFNYVQIRPSHDCEFYILTGYHLSIENVDSEGELYIFKIPKIEIKKLIVSYGGYAHGTIKEHGLITIDSLNDEKSVKEYALRPSINDKCWNSLMPFRISESSL